MHIIKRNGSEADFDPEKIVAWALAGGGHGPPFSAPRATNLPSKTAACASVFRHISVGKVGRAASMTPPRFLCVFDAIDNLHY